MISERAQRLKYVAGDYITANLAWLGYNCARFAMGGVRGYQSLHTFLTSDVVKLEQVVFPLIMMGVYYLSGYYNEVFRKSRLSELMTTLSSTCVNALITFIIALMNDMTADNRAFNNESVLVLLGIMFVLTYVVRAVITGYTSHKIKSRQWSFKTLIIGDGAAAYAFVGKLEHMRASLGYDIVGYVHIPGENGVKDIEKPRYSLDEVARVCQREGVKELIVVPTKQDSAQLLSAINRLFSINLPIKITPDKYNILLSRARLSDLYGDPLIDISSSNMSAGGQNMKRFCDVVISAVAMVVLIPVYIAVGLIIKCDSHGPVLYKQERLGRHNKPFHIIKFRTMVENAEQQGKPQLSSDADPRITRVGHYLRKYRVDELPQFFNVLRGDMSIVGPRPERRYYAQQILEREPAYSLVHQIRPGITSMGMVKYGYAQNVDEMVERLRYDLLYLENMSLINDLKIIVYTVKIVFTGRGV